MNEPDQRNAVIADAERFDSLKSLPPFHNVPTVQEIEARARRKRKDRNRSVGLSITVGVALLAIGLSIRGTSESRGVASRSHVADRVASRPSQAAFIAEPAKNVPAIRIYASVTAEVPVFAEDPATGHYLPVGWVETNDTIPVETKDFSMDEINQLRFLLAHKELLDGC
ncbi:MAG: hypothetical protein AAGJ83_07400 [Planctomycetota bacterium]